IVLNETVFVGLALREAVITSRLLNLDPVRFESDSSLLIKINASNALVAEIHTITADILNFAAGFSSASFVWFPREENRDADALAKCFLNIVEPLVVVDAVNAPN
ncbi:unnamed protein product, partial [Brassica oleracea var. botrytis]